MLRRAAVFLALCLLCGLAAQRTQASIVSYRTTPGTSGIVATDGWGDTTSGTAQALGFKISWVITAPRPADSPWWTYEYTISNKDGGALSKDLSHWILEVSEGTTVTMPDGTVLGGTPYTATSEGKSNPNLPGTLYGIKFASTSVTFTSTQEPVWGDFYARDGKDKLVTEGDGKVCVTAWNTGIGTEPTVDTTDFTPWILRPDSGGIPPQPQIVPEPSLAVLAIGAMVAGFYSRRRKQDAGG